MSATPWQAALERIEAAGWHIHIDHDTWQVDLIPRGGGPPADGAPAALVCAAQVCAGALPDEPAL